jgi:hypothetical protein
LERRSCKQNLRPTSECLFDGVPNLVGRLVDVAKAMGFVDDDQVPSDLADVGVF